MIAALLDIEAVWNEKIIRFEAVDLFTFDVNNKIVSLKPIFDTYPIRILR